MANRKYMLLRGCFTLGSFDANGKKTAGVNVHSTEISVTVEDTYAEHKNTCGEISTIDARDLVERIVKLKVSIDQLKKEILGIALGGTVTNTATGATFTAKTFPSGLADGDVVPIPGGYVNLASLTITDSNGTPATLTAGTHYTADLPGGLITILSLTGKTQPLKAAGAEKDDFDVIGLADEGKQERWGRFSGINLNDNNLPVVADFHRLSFNPVEVPLKQTGNDYSVFGFEPTLIKDESGDFDSTFGYYGRIVKANA